MQPITHAVILAAGYGTRMRPLTDSIPKPMVPICGKGALAHMLDVLPSTVTDVVVVVGYLHEQIESYFGKEYVMLGKSTNTPLSEPEKFTTFFSYVSQTPQVCFHFLIALLKKIWSYRAPKFLQRVCLRFFKPKLRTLRMCYVFQKERKGTGDALFLCKDILQNVPRFLVCMGDDIHSQGDIDALCTAGEQALLVKKVTTTFSGGAVVVNNEGVLVGIEEGQHTPPVLVNAAMYTLTPRIFDYPLVPIKNGAEYGLPQTIVSMVHDKENAVQVRVVEAQDWVQVTELVDIPKAESYLKSTGRCAIL